MEPLIRWVFMFKVGFILVALFMYSNAVFGMNDRMKQSWELYVRAWGKMELEQRTTLLRASISSEVLYSDPNVTDLNIDGLISHMEKFQNAIPGGSFVAGDLKVAGGNALAEWVSYKKEGLELTRGVDYLEFDAEGKIKKIVGFFKLSLNR